MADRIVAVCGLKYLGAFFLILSLVTGKVSTVFTWDLTGVSSKWYLGTLVNEGLLLKQSNELNLDFRQKFYTIFLSLRSKKLTLIKPLNMNITLSHHRLIQIFLAGLFIALLPSMLFWYLAVVILVTKLFVIICIIDFIRKTAFRKSIGSILIVLVLACISSLVVSYLLPGL